MRILTPKHFFPVEQLGDLDNILRVEIYDGNKKQGVMTLKQVRLKHLSTDIPNLSKNGFGSRPGIKVVK